MPLPIYMVFGSSKGRSSAIVSGADEHAAIDFGRHSKSSPLAQLRRMGDKLKHHTAVTTTEEEPGVSSSDRPAETAIPVAERANSGAVNAGYEHGSGSRSGSISNGSIANDSFDKPRRSFSSFRSFRTRNSTRASRSDGTVTPRQRTDAPTSTGVTPGSTRTPSQGPPRDGTTPGARNQPLSSDQVQAPHAAENPQEHLDGAPKDQSAAKRSQNGKGDVGRSKSTKSTTSKRGRREPKKLWLASTETTVHEDHEQSERAQRVVEYLHYIEENGIGAAKGFDDDNEEPAPENNRSNWFSSEFRRRDHPHMQALMHPIAAIENRHSAHSSPNKAQEEHEQGIKDERQLEQTVQQDENPQLQITLNDSGEYIDDPSVEHPRQLSQHQQSKQAQEYMQQMNGQPTTSLSRKHSQSTQFSNAPSVLQTSQPSTASQPSGTAAGALAPRNWFVAHGTTTSSGSTTVNGTDKDVMLKTAVQMADKDRFVDAPDKDGFVDAREGKEHGKSLEPSALQKDEEESRYVRNDSSVRANKISLDHASTKDLNWETLKPAKAEDDETVDPEADTYKKHLDPEEWARIKEIEPGPNFSDNSDTDQESDDSPDEEKINIPAGSVPGLGIGDQDPKLPHEKPSASDRKKKKRMEERQAKLKKVQDASGKNHSVWARERFLDEREKVRQKRQRQAEAAGWRQIGGWDPNQHENTKEETADLLQKSTLLDSYISEKYLGDWYQNAGLIVFTALFAWIMGRLKLSISWLSVVLLFSATAYRTSVRRMRRNTRDDILRQVLLEQSNEEDSESMEWLNSFLIKFWLIYEPSLSTTITEIGNEVLAEQTPGFIDSIKIDQFTLGTKAPRIDFVRSFPRTAAQVVVIDMGLSFTPNDTLDLTARQLQTKVNPKIKLGVRVGKGPFIKNLPVLLEDMMFKGKFRLRMKLMEQPPHIQTVDFSFLSPPDFDFVLKPLGGDMFGFDINIIPGLSKFIKDMVHANLGPMFYAPNAFQINLEQILAGVGVLSGVGVLTVHVIEAEDLRMGSDGRVDPYVLVRSKGNKDLAHTHIKRDTQNPKWNETLNVIITNASDSVLLDVIDFDADGPDRNIGQVPIEITKLIGSEVVRAEITSGGHCSGYLKYIAKYSPVIMASEDEEEHGRGVRDMKSGIINLKVTAARDLDASMSRTGRLSPYAEIEFSGKLIDSTKVARDTNDPEWNFGAEHIVRDKVSTLLSVRIKDNRGRGYVSPQIGLFKMRIDQLLIENEKEHKWFKLDEGDGEIKIETQWKPCNITIGGSTNNYAEPIGVMRLRILNAKNLRNLEHIGKIDPYARAFIGKRLVGRTDWFKNDLNPIWNETMYIPVQSELQDITIEVMDVENYAKDRSLGAFRIKLENIIRRDENDNLKVFVCDKSFVSKLMLPNRGPKGTVEYTMEFYPAIPILSPVDREHIHASQKLIDLFHKRIEENGGNMEQALTVRERNELISCEERLEFSGVDMPISEQLRFKAGVFTVAIVSLKGQRVGQRMRIIANNENLPIFTSPKFKNSKRYTSEDCPDFVSGQIYLSSLRFEIGTFSNRTTLSGVDEDDDGDVSEDDEYTNAHDINAAEITLSCHELLVDAYLNPKAYKMANGAVIELQARFFPLPGLLIEEDEDISQRGCIEINLVKAVNVMAADSSGLSDPYCAFYLNNESDKMYKSKTIKETLDPVWNEHFRFSVNEVKKGFVKAIVNDWDMGNPDDFLGGYKFDFCELKPLEWKEYAVDLLKIKKTRDVRDPKPAQGQLYLRMRFLPGHLQREGDHFVLGADSVTRAAGGLAHLGSTSVIGVVGGVGIGVSTAFGVVGAAVQGPHALKEKLHEIGNSVDKEKDKRNKDKKMLRQYSVNIDSLAGLTNIKNEVQLRCFMLGNKEREIFKSHAIKLVEGEATLDLSFSFESLPDVELGIKLLECKSLGRHTDLAQSSTDLSTGLKEVSLMEDVIVSLTLSED